MRANTHRRVTVGHRSFGVQVIPQGAMVIIVAPKMSLSQEAASKAPESITQDDLVMEPAVGLCSCGNRVVLSDFWNNTCDCGLIFNRDGILKGGRRIRVRDLRIKK